MGNWNSAPGALTSCSDRDLENALGSRDTRLYWEVIRPAEEYSTTLKLSLSDLKSFIERYYNRDTLYLLDDFEQALKNQVNGQHLPDKFMLDYMYYDDGFETPERREIMKRLIFRWSNEYEVQKEFGFLFVMYKPLFSKWKPSVVQLEETLGYMKDWLDKNHAETKTATPPASKMSTPAPLRD